MITRRHVLQACAAAAALRAAPRAVAVGNPAYPSRSVKWVVPYAPGGATDVLSRLLCQRLSDRLGQSFIVENKPGAGSNIGTQAVIGSAPDGYTLRHRTLANGIYWLETSTYKELLAVCFPIWNAELSAAALTLAKVTSQDRTAGISRTMSYLFFAKEFSCVPVYELMETRKEWDGTVIHRPALMNALWEYAPKYTRGLNGGEGHALDARTRQILEAADLEILPQPAASELIGMFPDVGTDFLLLE